MSKQLQRDLDRLERNLLALADNVEGAIHKAIRALRERNGRMASTVIAGDSQIDAGQDSLHEGCLKILAIHQPIAVDLRRVVSVILVTTDLKGMADLAEDIAERALALSTLPYLFIPGKLQRMADLATMMVRQSLDSFVNLNTEQAHAVMRLDEEVDRYNAEISVEVVCIMKESPASIEAALSLFSATRHLERITDRATNIAEGVFHLAEGELVRHNTIAASLAAEVGKRPRQATSAENG